MRVDSRKFLTVGLLLLLATLAVQGATSKQVNIVQDVSFSNNGDSLEARVTAGDDVKYTHFELARPHRLVVDFHGVQNSISFKEKHIGAAGVERVRTSFFSDRNRKATRIVFDLTKDVPYRFIEDGGGVVRILFGDTARAPENLTAGPAIVPEPRVYSISGTISPAMKLASLLPLAEPLGIPEPPPSQPAVARPAPQATASIAPTMSPLMAAAENSVRQPTLQQQQQQQQTQVTIIPPAAPQVPTTPTPIPQYQGELVSIDIKDYDLKDFFRLISDISGLNVVLDPNISGTTSLRLIDVPWDQALDVVLKNHQLGGQLQGNVLRIATNGTLQGEQTSQKALRDAQELAVPLITRTFTLNYTKADAAGAIMGRLLSPRGTILQDPRRNALIVSDIPSQFVNLDSMVRFLDTPAKQVEIEARLLQANKSFSRDIGNQLGFLIGNRTGNVLTGLPGQPSPFNRNPQPRASNGQGLPLIANFPAAATSGLSFLIQPGGDVILDEIISAAEARGTAKLISRPKVVTQNNVAATIEQSTQIPVQTNVNNTITVQFQRFGLNLNVIPQITEAGTILMNVTITNQQPDFARAVNGIPSVASQQATTQVLVPDGGTAVVGGILVDTDTINIRQVPGLGNLPVIGNLFKNTNTAKSTAELIFFITPRVKPLDAITVLTPGDENTSQQPQRR
jgi:type IV pilus assembly protein PilQ